MSEIQDTIKKTLIKELNPPTEFAVSAGSYLKNIWKYIR